MFSTHHIRGALSRCGGAACSVPLTMGTVHMRGDRAPTSLLIQSRYCNYRKTRVVTEDRVSNWCRRLWELPKQHLPIEAGQSANIRHLMARAKGGLRRPKDGNTEGDATEEEAAGHDEKWISELKTVIMSESGRLPSVLVGTIWEVYDAMVPQNVQANPKNNATTEYANKFFAFISLLTELDFDFKAVQDASNALQKELTVCSRLAKELETLKTEGSELDLRKKMDLQDQLANSKAAVVRLCFDTRTAGSPLYYTWLRHTASMESGIRRLMDLRKIVHFFDIECKRKISVLQVAPADATPQETQAKSNELQLWRRRRDEVTAIDTSLAVLFHDFFSKEYLVMDELTWFTTPPSLLDQIVKAENVHPFTDAIKDVKQRLQPTHHRHLFAFLHPAVVEEPLIAVQVALTKGISNSVDRILLRPTPLACPENKCAAAQAFQKHDRKYGPDTPDCENVDTAIFYSINSAQSALRGMDMGNMLIKRVVREIEENINATRQMRKLTTITSFSTLSPIPGYTRWLTTQIENLGSRVAAGEAKEGEVVRTTLFGFTGAKEQQTHFFEPLCDAALQYAEQHKLTDTNEHIKALLQARMRKDVNNANVHTMRFLSQLFQTPNDANPWWMDHAFTQVLERPLLRSIAHYLVEEKKRGRVLDPVGNFHVSNGATIFRLNFLGNATAQGSRESGCVMVNYWYKQDKISQNVADYEVKKTVAIAPFLEKLLEPIAFTA